MPISTFYSNGQAELSPKQQLTQAVAEGILGSYGKLYAEAGSVMTADAFLGGLLSAYIHIVHAHNQHQAGIKALGDVQTILSSPETIRIDAAGRA